MRTTKFAALFAAVALLVVGATFATFAAEPYWQPEGEEWTYYDKNGDQVFDAWAQSGDGWYHLNDDGIMDRSELIRQDDKKVYYVDETGKMVVDAWIKVIDDDYAEGDDDVNFRWFYFGADGKAYRDCKKDVPTAAGVKNFIFNEDAQMVYGWATKDKHFAEDYEHGEYYCGDPDDGAVVKDDWRNLVINEEDDTTAWFFFKATTGAKYFGGEKTVHGKKYLFDEFGAMQGEWATDTTISSNPGVGTTSNTFYTEDGSKVNKGWFFTWKPGTDTDDADEDDKNWYYAKKKNVIASNEVVVDGGKFYLVADDGVLVSGLVVVNWDANYKTGRVQSDFDDYADAVAHMDYASELYYCNEEHDGAFGCIKAGTFDVDDGDTTLTFKSAATIKKGFGTALKGASGNSWYTIGEKLTGDADENKYWLVALDDFALTGEHAPNRSKAKFADTGLKVDANAAPKEPEKITLHEVNGLSEYACMSASGTFYKTLSNRKESNGELKITVKQWIVTEVKEVE